MEPIVDSLSSAYQDFVDAAAGVLEAKEQSGGLKTPATDAALESFKQRWELFKVACDQAEEFVESLEQRIGSECLVDEATGSSPAAPLSARPAGIPPISAVRLEQMSKAVRWLVIELQHGSGLGSGGGSGGPNPQAVAAGAAPFDARFSEDAAQSSNKNGDVLVKDMNGSGELLAVVVETREIGDSTPEYWEQLANLIEEKSKFWD